MKASSALLAAFALCGATAGAQAQQYAAPMQEVHSEQMDWGYPGMGCGHPGMMGMGMGQPGGMGMHGGGHARMMMPMMIAMMDANNDGALSLEEVQAVHARMFAFIDKNRDGKIGRIEFLERMREAFFFVDINKDGVLTLAEYQLIQGADPRQFARADRNKDGKLSMDEFLKAITEDFDAADTNDDGVLDDAEVKAWIAH